MFWSCCDQIRIAVESNATGKIKVLRVGGVAVHVGWSSRQSYLTMSSNCYRLDAALSLTDLDGS